MKRCKAIQASNTHTHIRSTPIIWVMVNRTISHFMFRSHLNRWVLTWSYPAFVFGIPWSWALCVRHKLFKLGTVNSRNRTSVPVLRTGIRQGRPLSPCLFVVVMTVMFQGPDKRLNTPKQRSTIDCSNTLHSNDTFLFKDHAQSINELLAEI